MINASSVDLEESRIVWEAGEKARRRPCMWKECDTVLNSAKTLLAHMRRFHGNSVGLGGDEVRGCAVV